ncbi:MAG: hypothetical protein GY822_18665, partial [Deltaproteobacteria bacterium]|nr:hypothetical protein [Deltaproteobacteria bacterium]
KGSARSDNPTPRKRLKKRRRGKGNNNDNQPSLDSTSVMELEMEEVLFANDNEVGGGGAPKSKRKNKRKNKRKYGKGKGSEQRTLSKAEKDEIPACFGCLEKHLGICRHKKCDPKKQKQGLDALKEKLAKSGKKGDGFFLALMCKARRGKREKKDLNYPSGACKWCIAWGNEAGRSMHPEYACIFRPDGELQKQLKCEFKQMLSGFKPAEIRKARSLAFKEKFRLRDEKRLADKRANETRFAGTAERVPSSDVCERVRETDVSERVRDTDAGAPEPSEDQEEAGAEMEMEIQEQDFETPEIEVEMSKATSSDKDPVPPKKKRAKVNRTRDPLDPTFFEVQFAAVKMWKTPKEANTKPKLTAVRRYLYDNQSQRKSIAHQASNANKTVRNKIKRYNWVQLPKHYQKLPHQEYDPEAVELSDTDNSDDGAAAAGTNKFLSSARATTNAGYPEGKDHMSLDETIAIDKIVEDLGKAAAFKLTSKSKTKQKISLSERHKNKQALLRSCEGLANGNLGLFPLSKVVFCVDRDIQTWEDYHDLLIDTKGPLVLKELDDDDLAIVRRYQQLHCGTHQLTLKAIVLGGLDERELAHLKKCKIGCYRNMPHNTILSDREYARLVNQRGLQIAQGKCPVAKYRREHDQALRRAGAARSAQRKREEQEQVDSNPFPSLDSNGKFVTAAMRAANMPTSQKEVVVGAVAKLCPEDIPDDDGEGSPEDVANDHASD